MREGSSSPPPPAYRASLPPGHQDLTLNNPPTYREDEQHLLPQHQENAAKPKSKQPLIRLRNFGYQATLWKWVASIVVLGVSASSVSEDGLTGSWLAAMSYNLFCGAVNVVTPTTLCPRSKTDARPSIRTMAVLGVSTILWLASFILFIVFYVTRPEGKISSSTVYFCVLVGGAAFVLSLVQWYLVRKMGRMFSNSEVAEVYKTTIRMYWESNEEERKVPVLGTAGSSAGEGRNRVLEFIYRSNGFGLLRVVLSIVDLGIMGAAMTIGNGIFSKPMLAVVALNLATACLHVLLFTITLVPRSKTDAKPTKSTMAVLGFSSAMWIAAVVSIFFITITSDPLNVGDAKTVPGRKRPIPVSGIRIRLHGHGIAAGCIGVVACLCNAAQWFCVFKLWTKKFTLEERADAYEKAGRLLWNRSKKREQATGQGQELTALAR